MFGHVGPLTAPCASANLGLALGCFCPNLFVPRYLSTGLRVEAGFVARGAAFALLAGCVRCRCPAHTWPC